MTALPSPDRLRPTPAGPPTDRPASRPENRPPSGSERVGLATMERYADGSVSRGQALVAIEEPLLILVAGQGEFVVPRTPGDDASLIAGHLFTLGMIGSPDDILRIETDQIGDRAFVDLRPNRQSPRINAFPGLFRLPPEEIFRLRQGFEARQRLYHSTQATHAAALFRKDGTLLAYGEDVSRHCAFDKAVGRALADETLASADIAMLTSRLARELAVKASRSGIPVLCGFSAATSAGMEYARRHGLTLIGRIQEDSFNVYAGGWRLEY